ncbi:uncharacterized protein C1orf232 homolog isoform X2 [Lethenteron reissneri]|uniref:uncharacterized protein C1orf232 homolog isoform X2 n=1 Tax=Lethenteron reissneri TaxID=7753 RepID=UPI002AB6960D|nr:uncharacterized protein C1orf232 homolog isoform X2 [Lethenteron reissneri]
MTQGFWNSYKSKIARVLSENEDSMEENEPPPPPEKVNDGKLLEDVSTSVTQLASKVHGVSVRGWKDVTSLFSPKYGDHERLTENEEPESTRVDEREEERPPVKEEEEEERPSEKPDFWGALLKRQSSVTRSTQAASPFPGWGPQLNAGGAGLCGDHGGTEVAAAGGQPSEGALAESAGRAGEHRDPPASGLKALKATLFSHRLGDHERLTNNEGPQATAIADDHSEKAEKGDFWGTFLRKHLSPVRPPASPFADWGGGPSVANEADADDAAAAETVPTDAALGDQGELQGSFGASGGQSDALEQSFS